MIRLTFCLRVSGLDAAVVPHLDQLADPPPDEAVEHNEQEVGDQLDQKELGPEQVEDDVHGVAPARSIGKITGGLMKDLPD